MKAPKRIIIDTDPGIDDTLAILLALASPEVILEGLTVVHGNCPATQGVRNALNLLELAGASHIPVYQGCERPLVEDPLFAPETHGPTGLGYAELPPAAAEVREGHAVDFLIETIRKSPGEISLVTMGPLTNLAVALRLAPDVAEKVKELIIMGGAIRHEGNTTPLAEFNVYADPHAAQISFHAGLPTTLVPLDVTYQCILTAGDVSRIQPTEHPVAGFIADSTRFYMEFHDSYQQIKGCIINDPLALALAFHPDLCRYEDHFVDVDYSPGKSLGKTFADFYRMEGKPANMAVALEVEARDFIQLFVERIQTYIQ